ncbi:MAG: hypothetical protein KC438_02375 [Thermomicrobiales bacterium]|nr:hypothetical protein [Thermomicrobiales bacterium]MCO5223458.1 peptidase MA family metallohydrolase [Thermomicrobiales bacterium]
MPRFIRLALLAVLVLGAIGGAPRAAANQPPLIEADQSAQVSFPGSVTFFLNAETTVPILQAELRYATSGRAFSNAAVVTFEASTTVEASYTVDAQIDYIEPGVDITYSWILTSDEGPYGQTAESTITWVDESFGWDRLDSADVSVFAYDRDPEFDRFILDTAQQSVDTFKVLYDVAELEPVRIWVYANPADFSQTLRQNSEVWIGGFSMPEAGIIAVPIEAGDDYSVERVVTHEVSHHVLHQATKNPFSYVPTWLDEGLAVSGQWAGNENDLQIVLGALEEGSLPTLRTLTSSFPTDPAAANRSYATSHMAVVFVIEQWGEDAIPQLVRVFREGVTADQALESVLGVDTEGLDAAFREWLEQQR